MSRQTSLETMTMTEHGWTSHPSEARRFDTKAEAEAALATVGETVWAGRVVQKDVGGWREHPIVLVDIEYEDGRELRLFLESYVEEPPKA